MSMPARDINLAKIRYRETAARVSQQLARVGRLKVEGQPSEEAERLLTQLDAALDRFADEIVMCGLTRRGSRRH